MVEKLQEYFMKNNCKKQIKKNLESKKPSKEKVTKYMLSGKDMITHSIDGLIKKTWEIYKNESIFS